MINMPPSGTPTIVPPPADHSDLKVARAHSAVSFFDDGPGISATQLKRRVSFADNHGFELTQVVEFHDGASYGATTPLAHNSPDISPDWSSDEADETDCIDCLDAGQKCAYHLFMGKAPPLLDAVNIPRMGLSFLFTLCPKRDPGHGVNVALSVAKFDPKTCTLYGDILVANIAFEKKVFVRYTVDGWHSYTDVAAYYVDALPATNRDLFRFNFRLPYHLSMGSRVAFAVGYCAGSTAYWDNNRGANYEAMCTIPRVKSLPRNARLVVSSPPGSPALRSSRPFASSSPSLSPLSPSSPTMARSRHASEPYLSPNHIGAMRMLLSPPPKPSTAPRMHVAAVPEEDDKHHEHHERHTGDMSASISTPSTSPVRPAAEQLTGANAEHVDTSLPVLVEKPSPLSPTCNTPSVYGTSPSGLSAIQLVASAMGMTDLSKINTKDHDALESVHALSRLQLA